MPPNIYSRHRFSEVVTHAATGRLMLAARVPFRFRESSENLFHRAQTGDTWWSIAASAWAVLPYAARLWWILPDYQRTPVIDPTLSIAPGTLVVVPSLRMVSEEILSDRRLLEEVL